MPEINLNIDPTNYKVVSGKTWSITGLRVDNNFSSRCIFNDSTTESASGYYSSELGDNVSTGVYSTSGQFDNPDLRVSWNLIHPRGNQILGTEALRDPFFKSYEINIRNIDGTFKSGINFINNGSITAVDLISGGSGYINPTVFVSGDGTGAAIEVKTLGTGTFSALSGFSNIGFSGYATGIQSVNVVSGGSGYTAANTKLVVSGEGNDAHTIGDMALPVQGGDGITTVGSGALVEVAATGFGIREGYYLQNYIDIPYDLNKDIFGGEGQRKFMVEVITNDFYDHTSTGRIIVDFPEPEFESVNILDTKRGLSFGVTPKTGQVFENKIFEDASLEKIEIHKSTTSDFLVNTGEVFTSTLFHTFRPDNKNGEGKLSSLSEIDVPSEKFVEQDFFSGYFYKLVPYDKFGTGQILDIGTGIRIEKNIDPVDIPSGFRLITDQDKTVGTNIQGEVVTNTYLSWKKDIKFNTNQYEVTIEDDVEKDSYSITLNPPQISGIDFFISGTGANRADFDEKSAVQVGPEGMANDAFDIFAPYSTDGIQWVDHTVFLDSEYLATVSDSISNVEFVEVPAGNISSGYLYFTGLDGKHINYAGSNSFSLSTDNEEPHALVARNVNNEVIVEYEPRIKIPTKKDGSYNFKVRGINKLGEKSNYSNIVNFTASGAPSHFNFDPLDTSLKLGGTGTISKSGPFVTTVGGSGISAAGTGVVAVGGVNNTVTGEFSALVGGSGNQLLGGIGNPAESSFLGGGRGNYVSGNRNALVGGHFNLVSGDGQSLLGGANNILFGSNQDRTSGENQIGNEEAFGFENSAIVGGQINTVSGQINFIGGGDRNVIGLQLNRPATINGGPIEATDIDTVHKISSVSVLGSAIVGGTQNQIFGNYNFIGGGFKNKIFEGSNSQKGAFSAILGGQDNTITGTSTQGTSIIGGKDNVGAGLNSIIGGLQSTGEGAYSLAIGSYGWANHDGSFVLADGTQPAKVEGHRGHKKSLTTHSLNLFFENGTYVRNGDLYVSGDATVTGNLTVLGSFTLGDTTTDTLTSVGEIVTNDFVSGLSGYFGKVGIGSSTIDEDAVLQVTKPDVADPSRTEVARFLAITDAGNTNSSLRISSAVAGSQTSGRYVDLSVFDHNPTSRPLILQRDGGQVGIGTSIPDGAMLKVNGDASITGELKVNDEVHISNNLVHKGDTDTFLNFNADRIRLNAGGVELIDAREAGTDYVAIGGLEDNPDVNLLVGSAVNGIDFVLEVDAGTSTVGINCDPLDAKGSALVVSGDASLTGQLRTAGKVGIGDTEALNVTGPFHPIHVSDASDASILIDSYTDTVGTSAKLFFRTEADDSNVRVKGGIFFERLAGTYGNGIMRLAVDSAGDNNNVGIDDSKMVIDRHGNVLIGEGVGGQGAKLTVSGDASITGELRVAGEGEFATDLYVGDKIRHLGDSNTFLEFSNDLIYLKAGDVNLLELREVGSDYVSVGGLASNTADVNFFVNTEVAGQDYAFVVDAGLPAVGINIDPNNAKGAALVVSGDASITGELRVNRSGLFVKGSATENALVGINTTTPGNALEVRVENSDGSASTHGVRIGTANNAINFGASDSNYAWAQVRDADPYIIQPHAGKVGIGVTTPQALLQVDGDASITGELKVAGNVGIGASAPTSSIEVNGAAGTTFEFTDADGRSLTDLGGGILSWNAAAVLGSASWGGTADIEIDQVANSTRDILNVADKFDVSPIKNQIRLRDNVFISGDVEVSGDIAAVSSGIVADEGGYVSGTSGFFGKVGIGTTANVGEGNSYRLLVEAESDSGFDQGVAIKRFGSEHYGYLNFVGGSFNINSTQSATKILNNGTVGFTFRERGLFIGDGSPQASLVVDGDASISGELRTKTPLKVEADSPTSDAHYFRMSYDNSEGKLDVNRGKMRLQANDGIIYTDDDKIGIGTSAPDRYLHVHSGSAGSVTALSNSTAVIESSSHAALEFLSPNNKNSIIYFREVGGAYGYINYVHSTPAMNFSVGGGANMITLDAAGHVGIGEETPTAKLQVNGDASITGELRTNSTAIIAGDLMVGNTVVNIATSHATQKGLGFDASEGELEIAAGSAQGPLTLGRTTAGGMGAMIDLRQESNTFGTIKGKSTGGSYGNLEIDATGHLLLQENGGNVGIGTDTPGVKLHLYDTSEGPNITAQTPANDLIDVNLNANRSSADSTLSRINAQWNGTTVSQINFIAGDDNTNKDDGEMSFKVAQGGSLSEAIRISQNGNVGIGTDTPLSLFNVFGGAGHFNVAGASATGHHLIVSDGDPTDWRPYAGSTTASVQIQSSSSRGMLFAAKTAGNQDLIFTNGLNISVGATVGTNRGTDIISITEGGDVGITGELRVDDAIISTSTVDCTSLGVTTAIVHDGDSDTKITFDADRVQLLAGGQTIFDAREAGADYFAVGGIQGDDKDVNFVVNAAKDAVDYALWVDAGNANVGIGGVHGSSIEATLQVSGDASITGELRTNGSVGINGADPDSILQITNNDSSSYRFGFGGTSDVYFDADDVYFRSDNGGVNHITKKGGSLGIGVVNADALLQVNGDASITGELRTAGSVGIGQAPSSKLHVNSAGQDFTLRLSSTASRAGMVIDHPSSTDIMGSALVLASDNTYRLGTALYYHVSMTQAGGTELFGDGSPKMIINPDGEIIMSSAPGFDNSTSSLGAQLTVSGDASITGEARIAGVASVGGITTPTSSSNLNVLSLASIRFSAATATSKRLDFQAGNTQNLIQSVTNPLYFYDSSAVRMVLLQGGNVGIGTKNPSTELSISGSDGRPTIRLAGEKTSDGNFADIYATNNGTNGEAQISFRRVGADDATEMLFYTSAAGGSLTEQVRIESAGNVGIGTATPHAKLTVNGEASISGELRIERYISHGGDTDTFLDFSSDRILVYAGNTVMIDAREAGTDYVAIGGVGDNPDVNFLVGSAVNGTDFTLEVDAGSSTVGINCDPLDAKGSALVVSGDASISGEVRMQYAGGAPNGLSVKATSNRSKIVVSDNDTSAYMIAEDALASFGRQDHLDPANINISNGGNVGIGTTNPDTKLHLSTTTGAALRIERNDTSIATDDFYGEIQFEGQDNSAASSAGVRGKIVGVAEGADGTMGLAFYPSAGYSLPAEAMRIAGGGKVGIGTTNPGTLLEVFSSAPSISIKDGGVYGTNATPHLQFTDSNSAIGYVGILANAGTLDTWSISGDLRFAAGNDVKMQIKTDGNVGIGTTTPHQRLNIYQAADGNQFEGALKIGGVNANVGAFIGYNGLNSGRVNFTNLNDTGGSASTIKFGFGAATDGSPATQVLTINQAGKVGIGTTDPDGQLHVKGSTNKTIKLDATVADGSSSYTSLAFARNGNDKWRVFGFGDDRSLSFYNENTSSFQLTLKSDGNVGIGTTNPSTKLQVDGSFSATTKSFLINHPNPEKNLKGDKLQYASLEGPEHGVYVRGKANSKIIELPDYWIDLIDEESISIQLTPIKNYQELYVESIKDNKILIKNNKDNKINCFYTVYAERKDVDKLKVELTSVNN